MALYYCNWESGGKEFNSQRMHPSGEKNEGKVAFCTFPALVRVDLQLNARKVNVVVKASVFLEGDIS
jgi:hypothetical protein